MTKQINDIPLWIEYVNRDGDGGYFMPVETIEDYEAAIKIREAATAIEDATQ